MSSEGNMGKEVGRGPYPLELGERALGLFPVSHRDREGFTHSANSAQAPTMCQAVFLGVGDTTVNKMEEDTCFQSVYTLEGKQAIKHIDSH